MKSFHLVNQFAVPVCAEERPSIRADRDSWLITASPGDAQLRTFHKREIVPGMIDSNIPRKVVFNVTLARNIIKP